MPHIHSVYDTDKHFKINAATRVLENQTPEKVSVMQYDHDSERITFELPKTIEEHDMTTCNVVEVHYLNIDAQTKATNKGLYKVNDMGLSPADDTIAICSWLISQNATQLIGPLYFRLTFKCVTEGNVDYRWSTDIYKGLSVYEGIDCGDYVVEEYADILEQWIYEIDEKINKAIREALNSGDYKGEKGDKGDPLAFEDLTPEQIEALRGPKGADGTMSFEDLTEEQREYLRGPEGAPGEPGKTPARGTDYWTPEDIEEIKNYVDEAILGGEW